MNSIKNIIERFWKLVGFQGLSAEEFKKRTTAVQLALLTTFGGVTYSLLYVWLGFPFAPVATIIYVIVSLFNLGWLVISKNYNLFTTLQLTFIILDPIMAHIAIGGFVNSSGIILSAILSPFGALIFTSLRIARLFFYFFVLAVVIAGFWDYFLVDPIPKLPQEVRTIFFVISQLTIFTIIYFLTESFLYKKEELRLELIQSFENLKITQSQLIQREKMASLGELTAGIAHEIQNPLNFVNNFSEVSLELLEELEDLRKNGLPQADSENELYHDLKQNLIKICNHGKRADSIVKGMLLHSRSSTGQKVLADINGLVDEYLRLSYHGLRAKDKEFNVKLVTEYDENIGEVEVIAQDLGRVFLNLFNNAFYAVQQKKKIKKELYWPEVKVTTHLHNDTVQIIIRDNGCGIPENVRQKIFQPFFTTKPAGQGTGLGLSLSYDIITEAHGGEIGLDTEEGEFTQFTLSLPVKVNINTKTNLTI